MMIMMMIMMMANVRWQWRLPAGNDDYDYNDDDDDDDDYNDDDNYFQDFLSVAVAAPWARAISHNGVPYYIKSVFWWYDHDDDDDDDGDDDDRAGKYCTDGADYDFQPRYRDNPLGPPRAGQYLQVPYPVQHHQV